MKTGKTAMLIALGLVLYAVAGEVSAGGEHGQMALRRDFEVIDRDGDALLSWKEFKSRVMEVFYFADVDSDGRVKPDEAPRRMAGKFADIDANADRWLTSTEFVAYHKRLFRDADKDRDDKLSRDEVDALTRHE